MTDETETETGAPDGSVISHEKRIDLTAPELTQRAEELARVCGEIHVLREKRKVEALKGKREIEAKELSRDDLAQSIRNRFEHRMVDARWERDPEQLHMQLVDLTTGEVMDTRAMTHFERQGDLDLPEGEKPIEGEQLADEAGLPYENAPEDDAEAPHNDIH